MSEVYVSILRSPEGTFLHIARPGHPAEDIPLSVERQADLAGDLALSIRDAVQRAAGNVARRDTEWMARDAAAS